jgi:streptogramin lyase
MSAPRHAVVDSAGNVFVADTGNSQVDQFNKNNVVLSTIGANSGLNKAQAMARDAHGNVYIADTGNNRVVEYANDGTYLRSFNFSGASTTSGLMRNPSGGAIDAAGNIWVADTGNNQVEQFTPRGAFVQAITSTGLTSGRTKMNARAP